MEKDKSRGLKHIKDKRKYKANSVKINKHVPPKARPNLESNWDRYVKDEDELGDTVLTSATDFTLLANKPISSGSYYKFKSDEIVDNVTEDKVNHDIFSLDLNRIHDSICSVPFHERLEIDNKYFSEQDTDDMIKDTKYFVKRCNKLDELLVTPTSVPEKSNVNDEVQQPFIGQCEKTVEEELIKLELSDAKNQIVVNQSDSENDDLEQWLDDILDD